MPEVATCVFSANRPEGLFGGLEQRLKRPRLSPPQQGLLQGEGLLYGVEVRRVGWQQPQLAAPLLDQLPDPLALVHRYVVHKDYLTSFEGRGQDLPHVESERVGVR